MDVVCKFLRTQARTWHCGVWMPTLINQKHLGSVFPIFHPHTEQPLAIAAAVAMRGIKCIATGCKKIRLASNNCVPLYRA